MGTMDWTDLALLAPHYVAMAFAFAFGASAGSFINVVAWRMPLGMSVVSPPSRCPTCGYRLRWHQNLPIIGYLRLRGRCAACGVRYGPHYVVVEVAMGLLFAATYAVLFLPGHDSFWFDVGQGWWRSQGLLTALPALVAVLFGLGALAAMTLADARTFHIPMAIPVAGSLVAFAGWAIQGFVARQTVAPWPVPVPAWPLLTASLGGMVGVVVGWMLLRAGVLKESFSDYNDFVKEGETFADYPHARREMARELGFLALPVTCAIAGWAIGTSWWTGPAGGVEEAPLWLQAIGASSVGFLAGGAVIWGVRVVVSLLLGVEAMGLGDVHLMACVGAVFGWRAVVVGFVVAPFVGLSWWLVSLVRHAPMRVPFGPSLAIGGITAALLWPVLVAVFTGVLKGMAVVADVARASPAATLAIAAAAGALALFSAWRTGAARKGAGCWAAAAIVLLVGGVMAWVFGSPAGAWPTGLVGGWLALVSVLGMRLTRNACEPDGGPCTALSRIMGLMLLVVVVLGAFLLMVRSPESEQKPLWTPLQGATGQVQ